MESRFLLCTMPYDKLTVRDFETPVDNIDLECDASLQVVRVYYNVMEAKK
jgi:hypothetical protein